MKKKFDCVDMKHKAAIKIRQEIKRLGVDKELLYWQKKYRELEEKRMKLRKTVNK